MYESACCQGRCFAVVFSLSRAFLQGRVWRGCLVGSSSCFSFSSAFLSFVLEQLVLSFRRESCIRRGFRHEPVLIGCRIHPETCVPVRRVSRLAEPGRNLGRTWFRPRRSRQVAALETCRAAACTAPSSLPRRGGGRRRRWRGRVPWSARADGRASRHGSRDSS
jgi:hypothetical protein